MEQNQAQINQLISLLGSCLRGNSLDNSSSKTFLEAIDEYLDWAKFNLSSKSILLINISVNHFIKFRGNINLFQFDIRLCDQFLIYL